MARTIIKIIISFFSLMGILTVAESADFRDDCDNEELSMDFATRWTILIVRKELSTPDELEYKFYPVFTGSLHFKVRALHDAHIALTTGPEEADPMIEIFIGGWNNSKSVVRKNRTKPDVAKVATPGILSGGEFRGFWISWENGTISVGKEGEEESFLTYADPEPFGIRYYGVCTGWGATGDWLIAGDVDVGTISMEGGMINRRTSGSVDYSPDGLNETKVVERRNFSVDYDNDRFSMDGKTFQFISGSIDYFRIPRQYWRDRFRKMKAAGLNTISTHVEWSQHEPEIGQYDFSGDLNLIEFVETAEEEGLYVILKVGPYVSDDRDFGGHPYWLMRENPSIQLRTLDSTYKFYVEKWLATLLEHMSSKFYGNGGPIILIQMENGYGYREHFDENYKSWLGGVFDEYVRKAAVLFTTDWSMSGKFPNSYATIYAHPGRDVSALEKERRAIEPAGPFVVSEYYVGWVTNWGENFAEKNTDAVIKTLRDMLALNGSVNMFQFSGGTNFGFSSGGNTRDEEYISVTTSHDFDAPITEAGDLTMKYIKIRELLLERFDLNTTLPVNSTKGDYGLLSLKNVAKFPSLGWKNLMGFTTTEKYPPSFEEMYQDKGFVFYETTAFTAGKGTLELQAHDRATVFLNENMLGTLNRGDNSLDTSFKKGDTVGILVENSGRAVHGETDLKGILTNVTWNGLQLNDWKITNFFYDDLYKKLEFCSTVLPTCKDGPGFSVYTGTFSANTMSNIEYEGKLLLADSFLNVSKLTKGLVFVNDFNLGRYWSTRGPQYSLYVPGAYLKKEPELNTVVVIDEGIDTDVISIPFSKIPIYGPPK